MAITLVHSLSSVVLNYNLDPNLILDGHVIPTRDNIPIYQSTLLNNYVDVCINNDDILILTQPLQLSNIVDINEDTQLNLEDYIGSTTIQLSGGGYWDTNQNVLGTQDGFLIQMQDLFFLGFTESGVVSASPTNSLIFFTEFINDIIAISDTFNHYLTFDLATCALEFAEPIIPDVKGLQHFGYIIDGSNIILTTRIPDLSGSQRTIYFDTTSGLLSSAPSSNNPITWKNVFVLNNFKQSGINDFSAVQSNWSVYDQNDQSVNVSISKSQTNTQHNFLISTPYKTITDNILNVNLNPLKNYQTAEYGYILSSFSPYGRQYNAIFSGVNQEEGYDNIFFGFNSETQEILFQADKYTYFHFAPTSGNHPLSASTLVNSGAIAGKTPWQSDKVFKKQADYKKYSNWGNANIQNGVFFCSWLSGNESANIPPIWMDRYYNPIYSITALSGQQMQSLSALSNDLLQDTNNPLITDTPSTLLFEPGVLYIYHHIGKTRNQEVVNNLRSNNDLLLEFTSWGPTIFDQSGNNLNGTTVGFTLSANDINIDNIRNSVYNINGTYAFIDKIDNIFLNDELTFSFIVKVDDWENINGNQILGNYYNGGIGVFNNNPILTPYITLVDQVSGYIFHTNTNYQLVNKNVFKPYNNVLPVKLLKTNHDENYYILDVNQNILTYDNENVLQNIVSLTALAPSITATTIEIDGNYNFHILDSVAKKYYQISTTGTLLSSVSGVNGNVFALGFDNVPKFPSINSATYATVNSLGDFYYIDGTYLYRNDIIIWQSTALEGLLCDADDNIWITYNYNRLAKIDSVNHLVFTINTPVTAAGPGSRSLSYFRELAPTGISDFILIFDSRTQWIHRILPNGTTENSLPTSYFTNTIVAISGLTLFGISDNGFDFQRKYVLPNTTVPGISVKTFLREQYLNGATKKTHIQISTKGFHGVKHIALTFNYIKGIMKLYVDGVLQGQDIFDPVKYKISSNNNSHSIIIGTDASKHDVLVNELNQPGYYTLHGSIGDIRIFAKEFDVWDIKNLAANSKIHAYDDLVWNSPVGNRHYIEEVAHFFKHKMPGNKSQFYNIRLTGLNITDTNTRNLIETSIKNVLRQIAPAYATLNQIIWG